MSTDEVAVDLTVMVVLGLFVVVEFNLDAPGWTEMGWPRSGNTTAIAVDPTYPDRVLVVAVADESGLEESRTLGRMALDYIIQTLTEAGFVEVVVECG